MGFTIASPTMQELAFRAEQNQLNEFRANEELKRIRQGYDDSVSSFIQQNKPQQSVPNNVNGATQINVSNSAFIPKQLPMLKPNVINGNNIIEGIRSDRQKYKSNYPNGFGSATIYRGQ